MLSVFIDTTEDRIYVPAQADLKAAMVRRRKTWRIGTVDEEELASRYIELTDSTVAGRYLQEAHQAHREILAFQRVWLGGVWLFALQALRRLGRFVKSTKHGDYLSDHP